MTKRTCTVKGCTNKHEAKGFCSFHYQRQRNGVELTARNRKGNNGVTCEVPGCVSDVRSMNMCNLHYLRSLRGADLLAPPIKKPGAWSEWTLDNNGYVRRNRFDLTTRKTEWQLEHRVVMEESLGRKLFPGENVHHRNGSRHDNRVENLELWVTLQPQGQRPNDLLLYADEIIARYRKEF